MKHKHSFQRASVVAVVLLMAQFAFAAFVDDLIAQEKAKTGCEILDDFTGQLEAIQDDLDLYQAQSDSILGDLRKCLSGKTVTPAQEIKAHDLRALIYFTRKNTSAATIEIAAILKVQPGYEPAESDYYPTAYLDFVNRTLRLLRPEKSRKKRWPWIAAGAAAVGATAAFLLSRDDGPQQLPGPPGSPDSN